MDNFSNLFTTDEQGRVALKSEDDYLKMFNFERNQGLEPGSTLQAMQKVSDEVENHKMTQAAEDLTIASNPNINPVVAARHASLAEAPVSELAPARTILKRMSKTLSDNKIPYQVKKQSVEADKEELNQLTLRSAKYNGMRGIYASGGPAVDEESRFGRSTMPIQSEGTLTTPSGEAIPQREGRFYPNPYPEKENTVLDSIKEFMRTLERETPHFSGEAGQYQVAAARHRNELRMKAYLEHLKTATVQPGEALYQIGAGKATPLAAGYMPPPAPPKQPTTIEAALLQPDLTPERKQELVDLKRAIAGKGLQGNITLPDGTSISLGEEMSRLTPGSKTQIQKDIREAQGRFQEFNEISKNPRFKPENNLTFYNSGLAKFGAFLDEISPQISNFFQLQGSIKDFSAFKALTENLFTSWRRSVTGVAFRPEEEKALRQAFPSTEDGPTEFKAKLEAIKELNSRIINRLQTLRPGDKIDILDELRKAVPKPSLDLRQFYRK